MSDAYISAVMVTMSYAAVSLVAMTVVSMILFTPRAENIDKSQIR